MPPTTPATETLDVGLGDVAAALAAAEPTAKVLVQHDPEDPFPLVVTRRADHAVELVDLERFDGVPHRQKGTVEALTADGFIATFEARTLERGTRSPEAAIYADIDKVELVAVLNDDHADVPGWRDHRISYRPTPTAEWTHWMTNQGPGEQSRFAQVIETGEDEIIDPSATVMLEIAESFHASTNGKFKQQGRLSGGRVQFMWEEETDAKAGADGSVTIPPGFTLRLRPFYGAEPVEVYARLRWQLRGGKLAIGYELKRPDEILRRSFVADVVEHVATELPQVPVIHARPAVAR